MVEKTVQSFRWRITTRGAHSLACCVFVVKGSSSLIGEKDIDESPFALVLTVRYRRNVFENFDGKPQIAGCFKLRRGALNKRIRHGRMTCAATVDNHDQSGTFTTLTRNRVKG